MNKSKCIDKCEGCNRIENNYCKAYNNPAEKWRTGECPLCTTIHKMEGRKQEKLRVGQKKSKKKVAK
jgi:hypothetical protein